MNALPQNSRNNLIRLETLARACQDELETLVEDIRKQKSPVGNLRAVTRKNGYQYYITTQKGDTKGK